MGFFGLCLPVPLGTPGKSIAYGVSRRRLANTKPDRRNPTDPKNRWLAALFDPRPVHEKLGRSKGRVIRGAVSPGKPGMPIASRAISRAKLKTNSARQRQDEPEAVLPSPSAVRRHGERVGAPAHGRVRFGRQVMTTNLIACLFRRRSRIACGLGGARKGMP